MSESAPHILLVESDPDESRLLREGVQEAFRSPPVWVPVPGLDEALEQLRSGQFDIILLDLDAPGGESLAAILELQQAARGTPMLILTGAENQSLAVQAVKAGAEDYFIKGQVAIRALALLVRYAIEHHRLKAELRSLSLHDNLTGLHNRRGFSLLAEEQVKLVRRSSRGLLLFVCDVDGMKAINDTFGRSQGDTVLIEAAAILRTTFRSSDLIARLGEDEFAVLAIGSLPATAELLQARLKASLNKHALRSDRPYKLSLSSAISYAGPEDLLTLEELLARAYQTMDEQRQAGRKD